jgi:hypothetical protein
MKVKPDHVDLTKLDLILEVTRYCNLECSHCLRGDRQRVRMSQEVISDVFSQSTSWEGIQFSGGEPSLNITIIEKALDYAKIHGISFGSFWLATNGLTSTRRFFSIMYNWIEYAGEAFGECISSIRISRDIYHPSLTDKEITKFNLFEEEVQTYLFPSFSIEWNGAPYDSEKLIKSGRAKKNYYTNREPEQDLSFSISIDVDGNIYRELEGSLYITAKGNVINSCDLDFTAEDHEKDYYICKANEDIQEAIAKYFTDHSSYIHKYDNRKDKTIPFEQYVEEEEKEDEVPEL